MNNLLFFIISAGVFFSCKPQEAADPHAGHNHGPNEKHDDHSGHDHGPNEEHSDEETAGVSDQALKNMGVEIKEIDSSDFMVSVPVAAYLSNHPLSEQPVYAPFSGRIQKIELQPGQYIGPDQLLVSIIRDPIKRPQVKLVASLLTPASEEYHSTIANIRSSLKSLKLLQTELQRLNKFKSESDGLSVVPQKDLIDLRYDIAKEKQELENYRSKLKFHGLSSQEISKLEDGETFVQSPNLWKNALKKNNIWSTQSEKLFSSLPEQIQNDSWVIATIGELTVEGVVTSELIQYFNETPKARVYFLEIASMLQEGHSLTDIKNLQELGALDKTIKVKAPQNKLGWDLNKIHVKPGQMIARGEQLFSLSDPSNMLLKAKPSGSEFADINTAIKNDFTLNASPLIANGSPTLKNLAISKVLDTEDLSPTVLIPASNQVMHKTTINNIKYRNWDLRAGLRYTLKVPVRKLEDVIVLPAEAVLDHGADKVVFVQDGDAFIRRKVVVVYQSDEVAVIGEGSELLPEEPMVVRGAFALQLALIAGTPEAVDPHAGHNH
ncbi:hypothetical protein PQO01_05240 [Lentisphaera marina]|uniref:hypothetical protein n=1 Tax=Lentisphaera marina TaxID=1111041 RepID=UPI002365A51F|nr:hypothetical protein [Lentisphaera marina]MDD7984350.1 hypothetical protein [Lentisphaera marina]